jgi:hypothetical protein
MRDPRFRLWEDTGVGDLTALQALIDASWAKAGKAARGAWPEPNRIRAEGVATFLGQQRFCVIATTTPAGNPRLVPGSFVSMEDGTLWLPTVAGAGRLRDVRSLPRAAVVVGQGMSSEQTLVMLNGPVDLVESAELPAAVRAQARAKLGETAWAGCWLRLRPERLLAYSAAAE